MIKEVTNVVNAYGVVYDNTPVAKEVAEPKVEAVEEVEVIKVVEEAPIEEVEVTEEAPVEKPKKTRKKREGK